MPLHKGKSKKTRNQNIKEMVDSPTFAEGKSRAKKVQMAVAAAYEQQRKSKGKGKK